LRQYNGGIKSGFTPYDFEEILKGENKPGASEQDEITTSQGW
jgi:hypothetical protein